MTYSGRCIAVTDGDTFRAELVTEAAVPGWRVAVTSVPPLRVRLLGVACPEKRDPGGKEATAYAVDWLRAHDHDAPNRSLVFDGDRYDAFGRLLAVVACAADGAVLNLDLLLDGHAVPYRSGPDAVAHADALLELEAVGHRPAGNLLAALGAF